MKALCSLAILLIMASLSSGCATLLAAMRNRAVYYEEGFDGVTVTLTSPMQHPAGGPMGGNRTFTVRRGDTRETVISSCGPPGLTIGSNLWIYWNCAPPNTVAIQAGYDTLGVAFENNQVTEIRLVNSRDLRIRLERALPHMRQLE